MSNARDNGREQGMDDKRSPSRWLWVALILSLSVNMLIVGAVGAMVWLHFRGGAEDFGWMQRMHERRFGHGKDWREARRRFARLRLARPGLLTASMRWLMRKLPEERRQALWPVLRRHRPRVAEALEKVVEARKQLLELIRREPLDRAALQAATDALHRAELQGRRRILEMIDDFVLQLTPQERRRFVQIVQRKAQRRFLRRRF